MKKEVREVVEVALAAGFTFSRFTGSGHYKYKGPHGRDLILPASPRGNRWKKNALADIRREERRDIR